MILLVSILALWLGYYLREVLDTLKLISRRTGLLQAPQSKPNSSFVEPSNRAELMADLERERVEALNQ